jgi:hypothetical protein
LRRLARSVARVSIFVTLASTGVMAPSGPALAAAKGWMTWAAHVSLAPTRQPGRPLPGESWTVSRDGLTYELLLRRGATFHPGEAVTAGNVRSSFDRYPGAAARLLKGGAPVDVVGPLRVRVVRPTKTSGEGQVRRMSDDRGRPTP